MTEKRKVGRPTLWKPEFVEQVFALSLLGAKDEEIAGALDVHVDTVAAWKIDYPEFSEALRAGKTAADARVGKSLYQRANGFEWVEEQAFKVKKGKDVEEVEVVNVVRKVPPDTTAAIFWLKNRRRQDWRDVHQFEGGAGQTFVGINVIVRDGEQAAIEVSSAPAQIAGKPHGRTKP